MRLQPSHLWLMLLVASLSGGGAAALAQSSPEYRVTGTLIDSITGSAISRGHLAVAPVEPARSQARGDDSDGNAPLSAPVGSFDTDAQGHFNIALPSAGVWRVEARAPGFTAEAYQQHGEFFTAVVLSAQQPLINLRFQLNPEGSITGTVLDQAGETVREAQVTLLLVHPSSPDHAQSITTHAQTTTDDRGAYLFAGLPPGAYRVQVQAQPWYAIAAQPRHPNVGAFTPTDPSLDVAYPITWFPGTTDPLLAESLTLKAGEAREAHLSLLPVAANHLRFRAPDEPDSTRLNLAPVLAVIHPLGSDASSRTADQVSVQRNADGSIDVGGLAPGVYQVGLTGPGQLGGSSVVKVAGGQVQDIASNAASANARVSISLDGLPDRSVEVSLIENTTGRIFKSPHSDPALRAYEARGSIRRRESQKLERILEVPPGRYEVMLEGSSGVYLASISADRAQPDGHFVTLPYGASALTLHLAEGHAALTGTATFQAKPVAGAMVLLIPATLGNSSAIDIVRRAQSDTDGSFSVNQVIPGQYILIAIDNGWGVNWRDPATLSRYLMQGIPMDLKAGSEVKKSIIVQVP